MKKILKYTFASLLSLTLILGIGFYGLFHNELKTIQSIELIDDYGFYEATIYSDYALDDLIADHGASTDAQLTQYLVSKILKGLPIEFKIPDFGCSTFQAQNNEGDWIFARNYDLNDIPSMLIRTNPENGYQSVAMVNASVIGYDSHMDSVPLMKKVMTLAAPYAMMDGMNEKGLSIGVLLIKDAPTNQNTDKPDMTTTSMMRLVLDKAATVEEAIALFESYDMHASSNASYHFQMADASGDSCIIEYIDDEISVIRKGGDIPMLLTNFIVSPENYGFGKGFDRYDTILDALENNNYTLDEHEAMNVLSSVSQDKVNEDGSITATQWSVVYNNTDLTFDITIHGNFDTVYSYKLFD